MRHRNRVVLSVFALLVVAGCASTQISNRQILVTDTLPRPNNIWVYDFAATPADLPPDSEIAGQLGDQPTPQTAEQIATGRQVGAAIADELVAKIREMGMPADQASAGTTPHVNDLVIRGYILALQEGSAVKRVALGFGAGASELRVAVEGFQMTDQGLRKLGSGTVDSGGGKTPGAALGAAAFIATANPAGLIISTGMKAYGEASGRSTIEGRARATADDVAAQIKQRFQQQGWIQ